MKHYPTWLLLLALILPYPVNAVTITYSLDKEKVCNTIFNHPNLSDFIALREFLQYNPVYVERYNPADYNYCIDLKLGYSFYIQNQYSGQEFAQFYQNCMNMDDPQIATLNESFIRINSLINNCHLK